MSLYLIHFFSSSHLDAQILPDEGEQGGGEVNHSLIIYGLIHPDQFLES